MAFPILAVLVSLLAWFIPEWFVDFKSWIVPLLMLVMLGMGMTLRWQDFRDVWGMKAVVLLGVAIQFVVMPLAAWVLAVAMQLPLEWLIGMMLVGATAGGTASNVMTLLAKGHVALSVSMTWVSTLAAIVLLPLITEVSLSQRVEVPASSLFMSMLQIIALPIVVGMLLQHFFGRYITGLSLWLPRFSMAVILFIIAIVVALNAGSMQAGIGLLVLAVILHNLIGLLSGYWGAKWLGYDSVVARTVAIEVGMQNSGLSVALALKYFWAAAALPGALFSIWHNVSGSLLAYWAQRNSSFK